MERTVAAKTATRSASRPTRPPRGQVQVAPIPMQPAGTAAGAGGGGSFTDKIKAHPIISGGTLGIAAIAIYFIYEHFHNQSSTAATSTTGSGTGGGGSGYGYGGGGHYLGGGTGDSGSGTGSGGGGTSGNGSTASGGPAPVDLSGLTGLLTGIQTEIGQLGQEITTLGNLQSQGVPKTGTGGGSSGGGGTVKPLSYAQLPGVQPVNTLPASAKTVNVPVGGATYAIPYTGDKPSPAIVSAIGTTAAANAGLATNGITAADIKAAKQSVAAGAGIAGVGGATGAAPGPSNLSPMAGKSTPQLPARSTTAPAASKSTPVKSTAAAAASSSAKKAAAPAPAKPATTPAKTPAKGPTSVNAAAGKKA